MTIFTCSILANHFKAKSATGKYDWSKSWNLENNKEGPNDNLVLFSSFLAHDILLLLDIDDDNYIQLSSLFPSLGRLVKLLYEDVVMMVAIEHLKIEREQMFPLC